MDTVDLFVYQTTNWPILARWYVGRQLRKGSSFRKDRNPRDADDGNGLAENM